MNKSNPIKKILTTAIAVSGLLMMASSFAATPHREPPNKACPNIAGESPHPHFCPEVSTIKVVDLGGQHNRRFILEGPIRLESPGINPSSLLFKSPPGVRYRHHRIRVLGLSCGQTHGAGTKLTCVYRAEIKGRGITVTLVNDNIR